MGVKGYHIGVELDGNPYRNMPQRGYWEHGWRFAKKQFEPKTQTGKVWRPKARKENK
jgi:hypothetical protein